MTAPLLRRTALCAAATSLLAAHAMRAQVNTPLQQPAPAVATTQSAAATTQPAATTTQPGAGPVSARQHLNAETAFLTGAKHLRDSDFKAAEADFAHAVGFDPTRPEYLEALALAREHRVTSLVQQAAQARALNPAAADKLIDQARTLDSTNPQVVQHSTLRPLSAPVPQPIRTELAGAIVLQHNNTRHSYHLRADTKSLATLIGRDYGITILADAGVQAQPIRMDVDDIGYDDAMRIFAMLTHTMLAPLDGHTAIIAQDTAENRTRLERLVEETFYLPGYSADQMKDFVSIAQTIFDLKQVVAEPLHGVLVVRGPADVMDAVERVFADLLTGSSDVVIDVKLYEINKNHVRNIGVVMPQSLGAYSIAAEAQSIVASNSALITELQSSGVISSTTSTVQIAEYLVLSGLVSSSLISNSFLIFGGGATTAALTVGNSPTLNIALTQSDARTLDDVQLRASNREKVIFKSGTRYPIATSLFSDIATSSTSNLTVNGVSLSSLLASYLGTSTASSGATIPQVQYQDLGITVETTPRILANGEVGMHMDIKIAALAGTALNGIPILTSRQFSSDLTMRDGDTTMMVSNVTDEETAAVTGIPGVSELPGFQNSTNYDGDKITGELILMLTPHVVRQGHAAGVGPYIPVRPRSDND